MTTELFKRPIVIALFFLVAGILSARYLVPFLPFSSDIILTVGIFAAALSACAVINHFMKYPPIFLCAILTVAGFLGTLHNLADNVVPGDNITFTGVVQDSRYTSAGWQRLVVLADEGIQNGGNIHAAEGALLLTFLSPEYPVDIGQRVVLTGDLHELSQPTIPGAYNEFITQRAQGILARFNARSAETFGTYMNLTRITFLVRNRLADVYSAVLPYREARLIQSIVLGERPDVDDPVVGMYRAAGIYHLMVVSGLHLSILMMAVSVLLEKVLNKRTAGITALVIMLAYVFMTGAGISTVRAFTMAAVAVFARILYRDRDGATTVSFACLLLLLYQPLNLFSIGFQLSFGTVFGLVLLTEPTERGLAKLAKTLKFEKVLKPGVFRQLLAYNIVATVSTYPILAYHFSYISSYSVIINMIVAPTVVLLVVVGLLVGLVGLVSMGLAAFMAGVIYFILQFYEFVVRFFLALPGAVLLIGNRGFLATIMALLTMLAFGYMFSGFSGLTEDDNIFAKRGKVLALSVIILVAAVFFNELERRNFNFTDLQINSYVFHGSGVSVVVNGGGNNRILGTNTGATTLIPYLDYRGTEKATAVFATTAQTQHIMGLIELAESNRIAALYILDTINLNAGLGLRLQVAAASHSTPMHIISSADIVNVGNFTINFLGDTPLILQVSYDEHSIQLGGLG
ncbi:MAG: ComEC family competence protein [Defluviitaleaceae bacterium]|nr:ComEC family competence protein [Defluviitaleaceae bacterium]